MKKNPVLIVNFPCFKLTVAGSHVRSSNDHRKSLNKLTSCTVISGFTVNHKKKALIPNKVDELRVKLWLRFYLCMFLLLIKQIQ